MHSTMTGKHNFKLTATIDEKHLGTLLPKHKINDEEYKTVKNILKRPPTLAELGVFSAMWSEHCSYKSSRIHLKKLPTTGPQVVMGPGENAGVVQIEDDLCIAFKMESHNHPSYIEPYQGAATGVGGILRDVFCMGARPIANLNCLRFGKRSHPKTSHLFTHVVRGIGDYGNCVGIPTVAGNVSFDDCYDGNCLVNAMTVGTIHRQKIFTGHASGVGNYVVYVGSATGRDGIHGATMASDSFDSRDKEDRSAIQVGDPFKEKLLLEVTLEVLEKNIVVGLQDMGAAGLTSSAFEMADRGKSGLFIDLDKVPVRAQNMTAYELLLSESQERMLMVIAPDKWEEAQKVFEKWELDFGIIGIVTDTNRVQIAKDGILEVDLEVAPLTEQAPRYDRPVKNRELKSNYSDEATLLKIQELKVQKVLQKLLHDTGCKQPMFQQYDQHIGTQTALSSTDQGAAIMWLRSDWCHSKFLGLALSSACNESYTRADAYTGGAHAVLKAARAIAATGATPLATTDCLNYGNPEDPLVMDDFVKSLAGMSEACVKLNTPIVSGNVSFYNETDGVSIAPTPMIGMVGKIQDYRLAKPAQVSKRAMFYLLTPSHTTFSFAGSLAEKTFTTPSSATKLPDINWEYEVAAMDYLSKQLSHASITACRDVGQGGIATAVVKLLKGSNWKVSVETENNLAPELYLFGEHSGSYIIACENDEWLDHAALPDGLSIRFLGEALPSDDCEIQFGTSICSLKELKKAEGSSLVFDHSENEGVQ